MLRKKRPVRPAENAAAETLKPAAAEMQTEKAAASVEIKISKEDTWIEVRDNKKVYFNKVMRPGESYRVPGRQRDDFVGRQIQRRRGLRQRTADARSFSRTKK